MGCGGIGDFHSIFENDVGLMLIMCYVKRNKDLQDIII